MSLSESHSDQKPKTLKGLTLEELWQLFPIVLTPHRPQWSDWAKEEIQTLSVLLSEYSPVISHIGSTAIPDIQAKPIIDILVELDPATNLRCVRNDMEAGGYICMSSSDSRMSFNKGYTPTGYAERVFHIHFHPVGDNDEIFFRDYLKSHPQVAKDYESLKLSLLPRFRNNRDGYTAAKTDFVRTITTLARSDSDNPEL